MKDRDKTKKQLVDEPAKLRQLVTTPETAETKKPDQLGANPGYGQYQYRACYVKQRIGSLAWSQPE